MNLYVDKKNIDLITKYFTNKQNKLSHKCFNKAPLSTSQLTNRKINKEMTLKKKNNNVYFFKLEISYLNFQKSLLINN